MRLRLITCAVVLAGIAEAVIVSEGSPCSSRCGNDPDDTSKGELVCKQSEYGAGGAGEVFQDCNQCQLHSGYDNHKESDVQWLLFNLRYAASYCLFNFPDHGGALTTPCITSEACGPFETAMKFKNLTTDIAPYDYCALWPVTDEKHFDQCTACLHSGGEEYMANFITVLQAGCEQQPEDDATIAVKGEVFSSDFVEVADPATNAKVDPSWFDQGPITVPAMAGIVSGGVVVLLAIAGCCIIWRGKRKRRAFLANYEAKNGGGRGGARGKGWPSPIQTTNMRETGDTPLSQKPLRSWDESPMSTHSEKPFQRYFSPYSSQFNSPVSGSEAQQPQWPSIGPTHSQHVQHLQQLHHEQIYQQQQLQQHHHFQQAASVPRSMDQNIGLAIGGADSISQSSDSKDKISVPVEAYEMQNVGGDQNRRPAQGDDESMFTHTRQYSGSYRSFSQRMQDA